MNNDFATRIKDIELELTALKTAKSYTSVRPAQSSYSSNVTTGVYRITFNNSSGKPIAAQVYASRMGGVEYVGIARARKPQGNNMDVDVLTTSTDGTVRTTTLNIISNAPVSSVSKIG